MMPVLAFGVLLNVRYMYVYIHSRKCFWHDAFFPFGDVKHMVCLNDSLQS